MARSYHQLRADAAVLSNNETLGLHRGTMVPTMRLDVDGQNGITTDFRTLNAMLPYVKQNVLCFVLEVPRGFGWLPGGRELAIGLKSLMETHSEKIDGLDQSIKAEYEEVTMNTTEKYQVFTHSTRERSNPQHTWTEKEGLPIARLMRTWIVMLLADPITRVPGIISLSGAQEKFGRMGNAHRAYTRTVENVSMTCLYIEADPTGCYPQKAYLCTNMMPDNTGDWTASMDKTSPGSTQEISVTFTCAQEISAGVDNLAAHVLSMINKTGIASPHRRAYLGDTYQEVTELFIKDAIPNANIGNMITELRSVGYMGQSYEIGSPPSPLPVANNQIDGKQSINYMNGDKFDPYSRQLGEEGTVYREQQVVEENKINKD